MAPTLTLGSMGPVDAWYTLSASKRSPHSSSASTTLAIFTTAFISMEGSVARSLFQADLALPKTVILRSTTPFCVQMMLRSEPSATTA